MNEDAAAEVTPTAWPVIVSLIELIFLGDVPKGRFNDRRVTIAADLIISIINFLISVKADFLFSYQPPVNLVALCIMLPASYILSPRWFHKVFLYFLPHRHHHPLLTKILGERLHD